MPVAESEILIVAPPEKVWALISDLEGGPDWSTVTLQCEITSQGPLGVGSTYRAVSRFAAGKLTTEHEIVDWVPPSRIVTTVTKGAESTFTQTCEPQAGGSLLSMRNEFSVPAGVPGFVADKLAQQVTNTLARELACIKRVVEESHRGGEATSGNGGRSAGVPRRGK